MGHPAGRKEEGRARILESAGRGFRAQGFGGIGIDGLAKAAGVTSGAFYAHFRSKAEAFRAAVAAGMAELRAGIEQCRTQHGRDWRTAFIEFYMGERLTCDLAESCALQSLTGEVARADAGTRAAYTQELRGVLEAATAGELRRDRAIALLALLSGGVTLARAVDDPQLAQDIADAVRDAATALAQPAEPR